MPVDWIDAHSLSFNTLLLLEQVQLGWFPGWVPETELAIALEANPVVEWYVRHKCPRLNEWLDKVLSNTDHDSLQNDVRQAEIAVMQAINDLLVYAVDPAIYDAQPFLNWDSGELISLADFGSKTVIDVGAGTGRLTLTVAPMAAQVFAVEPVANLRRYLKTQAKDRGLENVFPADGLITEIPFPDRFADIAMGGHVFGDHPEEESRELERVTKVGGMVILCPGNNDRDNEVHDHLVCQGFQWSRFEEPGEGMKRKYWKTIECPPQITYRTLSRREIGRLAEIDRTESIDHIHYMRDGSLVLEEEHWDVPDWSPQEKQHRIAVLQEEYDAGATILGAFDGPSLVAMSVLGRTPLASGIARLNLAGLWVNHAHRNRGIGKALVRLAKQEARKRGAKALYVSATPSQNTIRFYMSRGFRLADPIDAHLFEEEPEDIHLELTLQ